MPKGKTSTLKQLRYLQQRLTVQENQKTLLQDKTRILSGRIVGLERKLNGLGNIIAGILIAVWFVYSLMVTAGWYNHGSPKQDFGAIVLSVILYVLVSVVAVMVILALTDLLRANKVFCSRAGDC